MPDKPSSMFESFIQTVIWLVEAPADFVRDKIVTPNQKSYPWYHQKFRRVPTVDECYTDDVVCYFEANCQYKRDRQVESEILTILRQRFEDCMMYEAPDHITKCRPLLNQLEEAQTNWFTKYGDLGGYHSVNTCYMKQKHRMIWERRHGPVGSGMKTKEVEVEVEAEAEPPAANEE